MMSKYALKLVLNNMIADDITTLRYRLAPFLTMIAAIILTASIRNGQSISKFKGSHGQNSAE